MEAGERRPPDKSRRRRGFVVAAVCVPLLVTVAAVALTLSLLHVADNFRRTFIARCEKFEEGHDCQKLWDTFEQAYVGKDPCDVPPEAYDPFVAAVSFKAPCNRMMFWSKTKDVVHRFTGKRECYFTLEDMLLGHVVDGLTWCGKEGSSETFTTGCPEWTECENNTVQSFWVRTSAAFADGACGHVTAMLNGSLTAPFSPLSFFGSIEVKRLNATRVRSLKVTLVTQENFVSDCTNESFRDLQKELDEGIQYSCKEVAETPMLECSSDPEEPCGACLRTYID